MIDFLMRVAGALPFLFIYVGVSSAAKRENWDRYEGTVVRLPRAVHSLLFPGAKWDRKPLFSIVLTATCLLSAFAVFVSSVWITFFLNVGETEKAFIYWHAIASICCCFLVVICIPFPLTIMRQKSIHIALRVVMVALSVVSLVIVGKPFVEFIARLLYNG